MTTLASPETGDECNKHSQRCLIACQRKYQRLECMRCNLPPLRSGSLVMQLFDDIWKLRYLSPNVPIASCLTKVHETIEKIRKDNIVGDHVIDSRAIRSQLFSVKDEYEVPLLYISLLSHSGMTNDAQILQTVDSLLDLGVPANIPYKAIPSIYHALLRRRNYNHSYDSETERLYTSFILKCLQVYTIPIPVARAIATPRSISIVEPYLTTSPEQDYFNSLTHNIITIAISHECPLVIIELFVRAGALPNALQLSELQNAQQKTMISGQATNQSTSTISTSLESDLKRDNDDNNDTLLTWRKNLRVGDTIDASNSGVFIFLQCLPAYVVAIQPSIDLDWKNDDLCLIRNDQDIIYEDQLQIAYHGWPWEYHMQILRSSDHIRPFTLDKYFTKLTDQRATYRDLPYRDSMLDIQKVVESAHKQWCNDRQELITLLTLSISCTPLSTLVVDYCGSFILSQSFITFVKKLQE